MDRALQFALSGQAYLYDALRVLRTAGATGVLRVVAGRVNGRVALRDGQPCAAHNGTTGSAGDVAVTEMRDAGVGIFHFAAVQLPANLAEYAISPSYREHLEEMAEDTRVKRFDEMFEQFMGSLPAQEQQLLHAYRQLQKDEERVAFLQENPDFLKHGSLNEQKLKVVRLYSQLNNEIDKRAFLKGNPQFHEVMMNATGLSDDQRQELVRAQYAVVDRDADFANFCRQLFGRTYPDLNEEQAVMLKATFLRLATQQNRRAFLSSNPLLSENAPVLRGEEVLPFVRLDEPAPEADELSAEERLAAFKLQALDYIEEVPERKTPYLRLRDLQAVEIEQQPPRKPVAAIGALGLLALAAVSFYAFNHGNPLVFNGLRDPMREGPARPQLPPLPLTVHMEDKKAPPATNPSPGDVSRTVPVPPGGDADMAAAEKLLSQGQFDQAATLMESYLAKHPGSINANIALVHCYMAGNKKKKARMLCLSIFKNMSLNNQDNYTLTQLWRQCMR